MADIWDAYVKKFGSAPKDATQLQQFSKTNASSKPLTFKDAREVFNAHKTKPVVTNGSNKKAPIKLGNKPLPSSKPIKKPLPSANKTHIQSKYTVQSKTNTKPKPKPKPNKGFIPPNPNKSPISPRRNNGNNRAFPSAQPISPRQKMNPKPKPFDVTSSKEEFKRQIEECQSEISELKSVQIDFYDTYNKKIEDIDKQFKSMYDALQKRQEDLKKWRKQEYDEGLAKINGTSQILQNRTDQLQGTLSKLEKDNNPTSEYNKTLYNVPNINDFKLNRFSQQALQINNVINNVFQIGQTYQQNVNNTNLVIMKINKNPQNNPQQMKSKMDKHALDFSNSPFGKGKIIKTDNYIPPGHAARSGPPKGQKNGTRAVKYDSNAGGIRGFDIGNNAKYAQAQQMARNTNALPSNFWEDEPDSDSDEERRETTGDVVNRWKTQSSNIQYGTQKSLVNKPMNNNNQHRPWKSNNTNNNNNYMRKSAPPKQFQPRKGGHQRVRSMYDASSSDDEEDEDDFDGFEKYVPPPKVVDPEAEKERKRKEEEDYWKNNNTVWIVKEMNKQFEYDTIWFSVPKMRNGKANGGQMKSFMEKSGLSNDLLKKIWRLSDLDKDGKMGNEEFALCMLLMEKAKKGEKLPDKLPKNYIPPGFRGKRLVRTPPKKSKPLPTQKSMPPSMNLAGNKQRSAPVKSTNSRGPKLGSNPNKIGGGGYSVKPKTNPNTGNIKIKPKVAPKQISPSQSPGPQSQAQAHVQKSRSPSPSPKPQTQAQNKEASPSSSGSKKKEASPSPKPQQDDTKEQVETSAIVEKAAEKSEQIKKEESVNEDKKEAVVANTDDVKEKQEDDNNAKPIDNNDNSGDQDK